MGSTTTGYTARKDEVTSGRLPRVEPEQRGVAPPPAQPHELTVLASVAHELRGPLTALTAAADLLAENFDRLSPQQVGDMLAAMQRRALRLQGLVDNLLCAASIRDGRLQLHRQSLCLDDLLADVSSVVGPVLAQRGQRLQVHMGPGLPPVAADSRRIGQVLVNLILNANKFGPDATPIEVGIARAPEGGVRLAIADRGPGVPADEMEHLFEPYYQAPSAAGGGQAGLGLGLSIVKSIVDAHGGVVGVENRRGGGARFWFRLPAASGAAPTGRPVRVESLPADGEDASASPEQGAIRFLGLPAGYEFSTLIADIVDVSTGTVALSEATQTELRGLEQDLHLQVSVTPT